MDRPFLIYTYCWLFLLTLALWHLASTRSTNKLLSRNYFRFLTVRWKTVTFAISATTVTFLGPYTTVDTWDWFDGGLMSILTYLTAPWAVGMIYRATRGWEPKTMLFPAVCVWLFSSSWCYDIYLFWRDGFYPSTWWANLVLSSILYLSAGLFWSLDWFPKKGVIFVFKEGDWPIANRDSSFSKLFWFALPFALIAIWLTVGYLKLFAS